MVFRRCVDKTSLAEVHQTLVKMLSAAAHDVAAVSSEMVSERCAMFRRLASAATNNPFSGAAQLPSRSRARAFIEQHVRDKDTARRVLACSYQRLPLEYYTRERVLALVGNSEALTDYDIQHMVASYLMVHHPVAVVKHGVAEPELPQLCPAVLGVVGETQLDNPDGLADLLLQCATKRAAYNACVACA